MGHLSEAKCLDCGATTTVSHGGGFRFHLLRCTTCGETKSVDFEELGELHLCYLKGLPGPYCMASAEYDRYIQEHAPVEPISEKQYRKRVEKFVGTCECGGSYTFNAPPRCSTCHSTRLEEISGAGGLCYD